MSMRQEVDVLNKSIVVDGCDFTDTGVTFARRDEATMLRAGAMLQKVENCRDWWWGDFLVAYAQWRLEDDNDSKDLAAMDESDKERHRRHYVRNHGSVTNGRELPETQVSRYRVAMFYTAGTRLSGLSNEHHQVAMDASDGDLSVAQGWLEKAQANDWSRNELRAEIRAAKRPGTVGEPQKVTVTQTELFAAKRWARKEIKRVDDMEEEEAGALLIDLAPIIELAERLRQRVAGNVKNPINGMGNSTHPRKESLSSAA